MSLAEIDVRHSFLCPRCGGGSQVKDSRPAFDGKAIRRRRKCMVDACGNRWTTYEIELPDDFQLDQVVAGAQQLTKARELVGKLIGGLEAFQRELFS